MKKHVALAAAAALAAVPAQAQISLNSRGLGMGGAYIGVARGQESLHYNPANLGLPNSPHWSAAIPQIVFGVQTLGVSPGEVFDLREYGKMTDAEREAFVADVPESGTGVELDVRAPVFALQIRRFAVGASFASVGDHSVNRSIVDLVLTGFQQSKLGQYNIQDTEGFRASFFDIHAAYGNRIGPVALGVTGHYYIPGAMVRSAFVDLRAIPANQIPTDVAVTYEGVQASGGGGFGVDVGAALQPIPGLTVSAALDNAFNSLEWNVDDLRLRSVTLTSSDYERGNAEGILNRYDDSEKAYAETGADEDTRALARQIVDDHDKGLPMTMRVGAAYSIRDVTTVGVQYQSQLEDSPFGGMWENQLSVGWQQKLPIVTLRAGIATDLADANLLSGGLTLGPIQLGAARLTGADEREGWIFSFALSGRSGTTMR